MAIKRGSDRPREHCNHSFITIESQFNSCLIFSHNFLHHFIIFLIFQKQKLTATDLTALISFLLSIFFNILLTWVSNKFDLYLMSLIHIPTKYKAIINLSYFQQYFIYIVVVYFTVGGKLKTLKKTISLLSLTNFITKYCIQYTLSYEGVELLW